MVDEMFFGSEERGASSSQIAILVLIEGVIFVSS